MKLSSLKIDSAKINAGDWVGDIPELGDIRFKVRGFDSQAYRSRRSELYAAVPASKRNDVETSDKVTLQLIVETILIDWSGLQDDNGKQIAYSRETAEKLLSDPDCKLLLDGVAWAAAKVGAVRGETLKDDAGN